FPLAQPGGDLVLAGARGAEGLLLRDPHLERLLELPAQGVVLQPRELGLDRSSGGGGRGYILLYYFKRAFYFIDLVRAFSLRESPFLDFPLGLLQRLALLGKALPGGGMLVAHGVQRRADRFQVCLERGQPVPGLGARRLFGRAQAGDLGQLAFDLAAALGMALLALRQLDVLELALVMALRERGARRAQLGESFVVLGERRLQRAEALARLARASLPFGDLGRQRLDFALAREDPGIGGIGRVEAHAEAAELVSFAVHQDRSGGKRFAVGRARRPVERVIGREPLVDHAFDLRLERLDPAHQRTQAVGAPEAGRRARSEHGELRRRRVGDEPLEPLEAAGVERVQPLAQRGLDGSLPAGIDPDLLPQPRARDELVALEPFLDVAVVLDPALDLLQRELPALERRELALERLRLVERGLVPGVERRARRLELREQRLLARELAAA